MIDGLERIQARNRLLLEEMRQEAPRFIGLLEAQVTTPRTLDMQNASSLEQPWPKHGWTSVSGYLFCCSVNPFSEVALQGKEIAYRPGLPRSARPLRQNTRTCGTATRQAHQRAGRIENQANLSVHASDQKTGCLSPMQLGNPYGSLGF